MNKLKNKEMMISMEIIIINWTIYNTLDWVGKVRAKLPTVCSESDEGLLVSLVELQQHQNCFFIFLYWDDCSENWDYWEESIEEDVNYSKKWKKAWVCEEQ